MTSGSLPASVRRLAAAPAGGWRSWSLVAGSVTLLLAIVLLLLSPQYRAAFHTTLFVLQMLDAPVRPQVWFTPEPLRQQVRYARPTGEGVADIYRNPGERRRAAVLLFLGANAAGRDDPDVINLGNALARTGFVVMLHWSPTMGLRNNIDSAEVENLVWAFQYLQRQDFVDPGRTGMGGFSVGGSFALVAAADPRIRDDVKFVNSFGAYYDARDLFLQVASGTRIYHNEQRTWTVDRLTRLVFANELLETIRDPSERELLERHFTRGEVLPSGEVENLSERALVVWKLLNGPTPGEAAVLLNTLPAEFQQQMAAISPSAHIAGLNTRLMVMHDQGDGLIPVEESRRLAEAMRGVDNFRYTETRLFEHVRPGARGNWWELLVEAARLYRHMYGIIRVAA